MELWMLVFFFSFNCFSSFESLQGVHRSWGEHKEIGRNFSVRNPLGLSYRDPLDARNAQEIKVCTRRSSGGITLQKVLSRSRNPFPRRSEGRHLWGLRKYSKSKKLKAQEEEHYRSLDHYRESVVIRFKPSVQALMLRTSRRENPWRPERKVERFRGGTSIPRKTLDQVKLRGG